MVARTSFGLGFEMFEDRLTPAATGLRSIFGTLPPKVLPASVRIETLPVKPDAPGDLKSGWVIADADNPRANSIAASDPKAGPVIADADNPRAAWTQAPPQPTQPVLDRIGESDGMVNYRLGLPPAPSANTAQWKIRYELTPLNSPDFVAPPPQVIEQVVEAGSSGMMLSLPIGYGVRLSIAAVNAAGVSSPFSDPMLFETHGELPTKAGELPEKDEVAPPDHSPASQEISVPKITFTKSF